MQGHTTWTALAVICGVVALSATYASDVKLYNSVARVSSTTMASPALLSRAPRFDTHTLSQKEVGVSEVDAPLFSGSSSTSAQTWSMPVVGALGAICGALMGRYLAIRATKDVALQPLLMLGVVAARGLSPEEALALWAPKEGSYTILDVRSDLEVREGLVRSENKGAVHIPLINAQSRYDSSAGKKVLLQEVNTQFLQQVQARIPKDKQLIVMCSDGGSRTAQAVNLLASAGYNVSALNGGYNKWDQLFDRDQRPRPKNERDSKAAKLQDTVQWIQWNSAGGRSSSIPVAPAPSSSPASSPAASRPSSAGSSLNILVTGPIYLDPAFQSATLTAFPPKANATVEEARVLWKNGGYALVDIRSDLERREGVVRGENKGAVEMPMFHAQSKYDSNLGKRVVSQQVNKSWLSDMTKRYPKDAKIIIMCSDGTSRSSQALDLLSAAGYTNLVLMRGGYNRWDQVFDKYMGLRSPAQQAAKAEWLDDPVQWDSWSGDVGVASPPHRQTSPMAAPEYRTERPVPSQGKFTEPAFQTATIQAFPARSRANADEARVLWKLDGYTIVDIRSEMEGFDGCRIRGPNKGSVDIPLINASTRYDPALSKKVVIQEPNPNWLRDMKARFKPDAKLIVMCSDGKIRSEAAVRQLTGAGFRNVVVLDGGYMAWDKRFDRMLAPRTASAAANKPTNDVFTWIV